MRFDYTKGQGAKYMVSIHRESGDDFYYFHYFKGAKELFDSAKTREAEGTSISLYDMKKDIRKEYVRV